MSNTVDRLREDVRKHTRRGTKIEDCFHCVLATDAADELDSFRALLGELLEELHEDSRITEHRWGRRIEAALAKKSNG